MKKSNNLKIEFGGLHPLSRLLFLFSFTSLLFASNYFYLAVIFTAFVFLIKASGYGLADKKHLILFALLFASSFAWNFIVSLDLTESILQGLLISFKLFALIVTGFIYPESISPSEISWLLRKASKKSLLSVSLLVAFKVLPTIEGNSRKIILAQKTRGMKLKHAGIKKLAEAFTCFLVAFLSLYLDFLSNIALMLEIKGIKSGNKKIYSQFSFRLIDYLAVAYSLSMLALPLLLP